MILTQYTLGVRGVGDSAISSFPKQAQPVLSAAKSAAVLHTAMSFPHFAEPIIGPATSNDIGYDSTRSQTCSVCGMAADFIQRQEERVCRQSQPVFWCSVSARPRDACRLPCGLDT